jgi:hypothetical protein
LGRQSFLSKLKIYLGDPIGSPIFTIHKQINKYNMKKILMVAIILIASVSTYSQKYIVTPTGLKDEANIEKSFVVITAEGKTAKQLFDNAVKYVNVTYKNPNIVIKGKIDGEYLSFVTSSDFYVGSGLSKNPFVMEYVTSMTFKDGKVKLEIIELEMTFKRNPSFKLYFTGGGINYFIYNKSGELKKEDTKEYLEVYFNTEIKRIKDYLEEKTTLTKKDDF